MSKSPVAGSAHGRASLTTTLALASFMPTAFAETPSAMPADTVAVSSSRGTPDIDDVFVSDSGERTGRPSDARSSGVVIRERRSYYDVDATGIADMRRQLETRGPRNAFGHQTMGLTRSTLTAHYPLWSSPGRCAIGEVVVESEIDLHLPRWRPAGTPRQALSERWEWLSTALREHEEGHREHGVWAAHELQRRLQALPVAPDCKSLERAARLVRQAVVAELRSQDAEYDARTDYGRAALAERVEAERQQQRETDAERETQRARRLIQGF
jgi:predicted secreted Zn-dependent protease